MLLELYLYLYLYSGGCEVERREGDMSLWKIGMG